MTTHQTPRPSIRQAIRDGLAAGKAQAEGRPAPVTAEQPAGPPKRKWTDLPTAQFKGEDGQLQLFRDGLDYIAKLDRTTLPLESIRSVSVEDGADLEARITATRLVLVGVFALAWRKRTGGEKYLTVEADDRFVAVTVSRRDITKAQRFAADLRTAIKGATA